MELVVFAVVHGYDYGSEDVLKVFKTKEGAEEFLEKCKIHYKSWSSSEWVPSIRGDTWENCSQYPRIDNWSVEE